MKQVYDLLDKVRDELRGNPSVFTVSFGDISDVDLAKTTIFPLTHLMIESAVLEERAIAFTLKVLCLDIVDYNKESSNFDDFYGNNNFQDVLNTQFQVINSIVMKLRRGGLYDDLLQVEDNVTVTPFKERFENELAGWGADIVIKIPNGISIC